MTKLHGGFILIIKYLKTFSTDRVIKTMAGATGRARYDLRITARMLDDGMMEAVGRRGADNNVQAEVGDSGQEDQVIDEVRVREAAVIDGAEEAGKWLRRTGRLNHNSAGNWRRAGRLISLEK